MHVLAKVVPQSYLLLHFRHCMHVEPYIAIEDWLSVGRTAAIVGFRGVLPSLFNYFGIGL